MARITRFSIAKSDIISHLDQNPTKVYNIAQIAAILDEKRAFWRLPISMTAKKFIAELIKTGRAKTIKLKFPSRSHTRYTWGEVSEYEVISQMFPTAFLCHYTAMHLHNLTNQFPKTIYTKAELTYTTKNSEIENQESIDRSFRNNPRLSNNSAIFNDHTVYLLYGKKIGNIGGIKMDSDFGKSLNVTDIERTLIDSAMRPFYSGGIHEVAEAFRLARPNVSINKLVAYLKQMNYTYPYHQAIGYYLQKSGEYSSAQLDLLKDIGIRYKFYIDYKIVNPEFNTEWQLFIPQGF